MDLHPAAGAPLGPRAAQAFLGLFFLVAPPLPSRDVTVFAAVSLTEAFTEIGDSLTARDPAVRVRFNFAGSQLLALQLEQGAPADVFASADERWITFVRDSGLVGAPHCFAESELIGVASTKAQRVAALVDLARPGLRVVLASDAVPAGRYARQLLDALGHTPGFPADFAARVLANVVSNEENVRAVLTKVTLGEADAGFVYSSDAPAGTPGVLRLAVPPRARVVGRYFIAPARVRADPADAQAFLALVLGPVGRAILARHGFLPPTAL